MTDEFDNSTSLYAEYAATPRGSLDLAAAEAAGKVAGLFDRARDKSGMASKDVARRLELTPGRVSQILNGDGNVHIATAARFLRAMGYQLKVTAVPVEPERPSLDDYPRRPQLRKEARERAAAQESGPRGRQGGQSS